MTQIDRSRYRGLTQIDRFLYEISTTKTQEIYNLNRSISICSSKQGSIRGTKGSTTCDNRINLLANNYSYLYHVI